MKPAVVRFVGKPWPNHSEHSGYHQLISRLGSEVPAPDTSAFLETLFPGRLAVALARRSGVRHYGFQAFFHEWVTAREMFTRRERSVYHVLYGDQFFRYLGRLRLWRGSKLVASFHMPPARLEESLQTVSHLNTLDALVVVGSSQVPYFRSVVSPERIHVVPHGVDTEVFCPAAQPRRSDSRGKTCLFVGMHERDFDTLSAVIDAVRKQDESIEFVLVTSTDKEAKFAGRPGVTFRSGITEESLIELYQQSDVMIQPLLECTANNALLEGLACGLPVIASDLGSVRDYLTDDCAVLVPSGDPGQMAEALLALLKDKDRRRLMGAMARRRALEYDWSRIASQMRCVYDTLFTM